MGIFKGNYNSSIQENHQFFCDEFLDFNKSDIAKDGVKIIKQLGLTSFTKKSCKYIFDNNLKFIKNTDLFKQLPEEAKSGLPEDKTIIDFEFVNAHYKEFNKSAARFNDTSTTITLTKIYELIDYHENRQFDDEYPKNNDLEELLEKINTSLEKCIIIENNFFDLGKVAFKLIFQNRRLRSNDRGISLNGVTISAIPQTPYGQQYSYANTSNLQTQGIEQVGSLIPIADENNVFSQDKTAAPLQVNFDPNTNTFKSGNPQMLARLLTDVEPAEVQSLPEGDLNEITTDEMIERLSAFTTGKALPLSPQQSNPFLFGPDYVECGRKKIVEITVVNRSLRKFSKDQIVMLTEINGEWIIQDFGQDSAFESSTKFGDWHFIKLIANTDTYFKDDRYYETGDFSNPITPTEYEVQSRLKFYENFKVSLANDMSELEKAYPSDIGPQKDIRNIILNLNDSNQKSSFKPSKRYYISSIFDQLPKEICGFSDKNYLLATNIEDTNIFADKTLLFKYAQEVPGFWGPVYSDGHSSFEINKELLSTTSIESHDTFFEVPDQLLSDSAMIAYLPQSNGNYKLHIPAELSSMFIDPFYIFSYWNELGNYGERYYSRNPYQKSPFYGTTIPTTKNRIQFSPLQAEFAGSDDLLSTKAKDYSRQFYNIIRSVIGTKLNIDVANIKTLFGKMYDRSDFYNDRDGDHLITDVSNCGSPSYDNAQESFTQIANNFKSVKYDCFVKRGGVNSGLVGSPAIFRKSGGADGGYCVGIISAKNTITKKSGGKLNYSLNQDFGLNQQRASTVATNFLTIIPGIFSAGGSAGGGMSYGFPQWGSTTDNINSFGTTALHVRIFDYWPEESTVFDPRYFGVLHFNPNDESVDIPIPSYFSEEENAPVAWPIYALLSAGDLILPESQWIKSTIRRNKLLTGGGFKYLMPRIGLENGGTILFGGTGFSSNFDFTIRNKNAILKLTVSGGKIINSEIQGGSPIKGYMWLRTEAEYLYRGHFSINDLNMPRPIFDDNGNLTGTSTDPEQKGFVVNIPSPDPTGKPATIFFSTLMIYHQEMIDYPPKEQVPLTRLTSSSKRGEGFIQEVKESDFTLERNSSGKYDCFYHFHNDITHTLITDQPFVAGFLQHVTMTIT